MRRKGHAGIALRFCRVQQPLDAEKTLEMSHHVLKAHIYKSTPNMPTDLSSRDMQALWMLSSSESITEALCCVRNIYSPTVKVLNILF